MTTSNTIMGDEYAKAKRHPDGTLFESTLKMDGKGFFCDCGCNVFHIPDFENPDTYRCNACMKIYYTLPLLAKKIG